MMEENEASENLVEQFSKKYPLVLLREGASKRREIVENTLLDPNSWAAWFDEDKTGPDSDIVRVGNFTWHRRKSNENITDTDEGKSFSFFYARYVFDDEKRRTVHQDNGNDRTIGKINEEILSVIDTRDDRGLIRIISAWEINDPHSKWIRYYIQGGAKITESIAKYGEPIYPGASDEQSERYYQETLEYSKKYNLLNPSKKN